MIETRAQAISNDLKDTARLDWLISHLATVYRSSNHWVVVDETLKDRSGIIGKSLRSAIDAAMRERQPQPEGGK